jgi:NADPH-dependent curcumin reductase CurA
VVLRSESSSFHKGQHVYGQLGTLFSSAVINDYLPDARLPEFAEYAVVKNSSQLKVLPEDSGLQWSTFGGAAGMPGQTAYTAWKEYAHPKPGQVAFVSGGAGPVGSFVIQLAKQDGLKVIASAGSDAKVEFMKNVGADVAFNYKTTCTLLSSPSRLSQWLTYSTATQDVLAKEGPIDVYWDNVGGETLDAALANASIGARFIECGMISGYNNSQGNGIKNILKVLEKRIHMTGIMVFDLLSKYEKEFYETVPKALAEGKIKYAEHVYRGLDSANQAILDVQTGKNDAKAIILVADE